MLSVVGPCLKVMKFFYAIFVKCCMMLRSFGQVRATMLRPGMRIGTIFNTQRVATHRDRVVKRDKHFASNSVAICRVKILRWFVRGLSYPPRYL